MNDLAASFLSRLGTASLFLALTGIVAFVVLRVSRCSSPLVHRVTWCMVLVQGVLVFQLPVQIPWSAPTLAQSTIASEIATNEVSIATNPTYMNESHAVRIGEVSASTSLLQNNWANLLLTGWISGIVFILARWIRSYTTFVRSIASEPCDREEWCNEWMELVTTSREANVPEFHVSANIGPMLCRLPSGYRIVVPYELWRRLTSGQRKSILRHELAHFERRDVLKTLVANLLALLHWFNPMAWFASRKVEDSIEWTCDDRVRCTEPSNSTNYAKALLAIGECSRQKSAWSTAVFGGKFADRIRRVLSDELQPVSRFRIGAILGLLVACLALHVFQVELVAQNPEKPNAAVVVPDVSTVHKDFFVAPVKTVFQQWYLKGHRTKKETDDRGFSAYANINLMSLTDGKNDTIDTSRFDLEALSEAMKKADQALKKGKLYLHLDHGPLMENEKTEAFNKSVVEVCERVGFSSRQRVKSFRAKNDWYGLLDKDKGASDLDEPQLGDEQVVVFPIKTPLSRFLTSRSSSEEVHCYIEIRKPVGLDAKEFLSDSDKSIIREAVGKLTVPADGVVRLQINLQKPKTVEEIRGLAQVKLNSDYHREPTEFLKSLGFKKVVFCVDCNSSLFLSQY